MILQVALDMPARRLFDYAPPAGTTPPPPGSRVLCPFGPAERLGIVLAHAPASELPPERIKPIRAVLHDLPPLPATIIELLRQAVTHSQQPIGRLAFAAFPPQARKALRDPGQPPPPREAVPPQLAAAREPRLAGVARQAATAACRQLPEGFAVHLVCGAPGSGKAAVAQAALSACVRMGRTALVLAPGINEVERLAADLEGALPGCRIVRYHSELTPATLLANWRAALAGACHVLVGSRSAVFAPLPDLGLVWLVNENDAQHRAEQGLNFCARYLGALRARLARCPALMTAVTPSVELRHAAMKQRVHMTALPRAADRPAPHVQVVDVTGRRLFGGISPEMENALRHQMRARGLAVVLVNRRGQGSMLFCGECRHLVRCPTPACKRMLTVDAKNACRCNNCGFSKPRPANCPACGGARLDVLRPGSGRVAESLHSRLPEARIVKVDATTDTTGLQDAIAAGRVDIVVGTNQLLGLQLDAGTVVVADADSILHGTHYRGAEFLLDTVTKLTAHTAEPRVVIQTRFAGHHVFEALRRGSADTFLFAELEERKAAGLPPFRRMALLTAKGPDSGDLAHFIGGARQLAADVMPRSVSVLESVTASAGDTRQVQLLVNAPDRNELARALDAWLPHLDKTRLPKGASWNVMVDPETW